MDQQRFDDLARVLGAGATRRSGLRAALGGLLGMGGGAVGLGADAARRGAGDTHADADADRKRRRKRCKPACTDGFTCVKVGRKRACECVTGVICGAACCLVGQECQSGQCVPNPGACIAAGDMCKSVGLPCCGGRVCASGQGGQADVACYAPKTGACQSTGDCVYGMSCQAGRCLPPAPGALGQPCDAAAQQLCTTPGAVCAAYTGAGSPAGAHCALPLQKVCTGNPQCTCYRCWYTEATAAPQRRRGRDRDRGESRTSTNTMACCHVAGLACAVDQDCCLGLSCVNGTCDGTMCAPDGGEGCDASVPCCNPAATCVDGVCVAAPPAELGEVCEVSAPQPCITPAASCTDYDDPGAPAGAHCSLPDGSTCAGAGECTDFLCAPANAVVGGSSRSARDYVPEPATSLTCCTAAGDACQEHGDCCFGNFCDGGTCITCTIEAVHVTPNVTNANSNGLTPPINVAFLSDGRMVTVTESSGFAGAKVLVQGPPGTWTVQGSISVPSSSQPYSTQLPQGIAVDEDDTVYIAYKSSEGVTFNRVIIFSESGGSWSQVGEFGQGSANPTENLRDPKNLAFGPDGRLYVTEAVTSYGRVSIWRKSGGAWVFDEAFGSFSTLNYPAGITLDRYGNVYVSSEYNNNPNVSPVSVWTKSGGTWTRTATIGTYYASGTITDSEFEQPYGMALVGNLLFVVDNWQSRVSIWQRIDGTWTAQSTFGSFGVNQNSPTTDQFGGNPQGVAFGPGSLVYVADAGNLIISPWKLTCFD